MDSQRFDVRILADEMQNLCVLVRRQREQSIALREQTRIMRQRLRNIRSTRRGLATGSFAAEHEGAC
jgi:hypothetical protein